MYTSVFVIIFTLVLYVYTYYPYQTGCRYETDCHGCTTCIDHECVDYRYGDPCNHTMVVKDLKLYYAFYYGHEIDVPSMLCHNNHTAARIIIKRTPSSPIQKHLYHKQAQHVSQRIDRCGHQTWSYGSQPVKAPKAVEAPQPVKAPKVVGDGKVVGRVLVWNSMRMNHVERCDVPCRYTTVDSALVDGYVYELRGRVEPRVTDKATVYMQMESEMYYPINTSGWTVENSYRWRSPILKPYFEWVNMKEIQVPRVSLDAIDGVSFLARNCHSKNARERIVTGLMDLGIRVDSMSTCLHNKEKPDVGDDKVKIMRLYKFHAAFENSNGMDYVTEKVYLALAAGTVPVYFGAPNIDLFVPHGSIIRVDDFDSLQSLSNHLKDCMKNDSLYDQYHAWRRRPLDPFFVRRFEFTKATTECRTCRWLYARRHGYTWYHDLQHFKPVEFSNVLWSRNYRSDSAIPEEYYESGTESHLSGQRMLSWFRNCSGLIWLRMGSSASQSDVYKFVTRVLDRLTSRFKLVTTDGDLSVPGSFDRSLVLRVLDHPLCDGWYTQNYDGSIVHEKLHAIPIGFDMHTYRTGLWSHTPLINWKHMLTLRSQSMERQDVVYIPSWSYDHPDRFRVEPQTRCLGSRRVSGKHKPLLDLWKDYKRYRYGFSPHGNGLDCHRTWEMLFYGMIPVVKTSSLDVLYRDLSVVVVSEWSEVCQEGVLVDKGLRGIQVFDKRYWLQ